MTLAELQHLNNQNYGFMVIGKSGLDDEDLYNRALNGEDISGVIGLSQLQDVSDLLNPRAKMPSRKAKKSKKHATRLVNLSAVNCAKNVKYHDVNNIGKIEVHMSEGHCFKGTINSGAVGS